MELPYRLVRRVGGSRSSPRSLRESDTPVKNRILLCQDPEDETEDRTELSLVRSQDCRRDLRRFSKGEEFNRSVKDNEKDFLGRVSPHFRRLRDRGSIMSGLSVGQ